ncbi:polysaccharide pyruvyl transferase family protein [Sphingomonas profundi]|uniref:polysaccharide pyruvyl transferase family protein n=1 Tax=Alterirhizorhabdus profundi TaxID=2681549 RepID=UPI0012E7C5CD|nr:polysaccharide pyruvyl transferase family protein [Sphingomonas profundi]
MKVGVLTFHRCINYGSYWQARCLVEGLRGMGHDAELLDHDSPQVRRAEWRCAFQPQLPLRTRRDDLPRYAAKGRRFLDAFDRLPQSPRFALDRPEDAGAYDAVLVGSDEVWNFRHPWYGFKPIFFGERLQSRRLASYAASFGNHDAAHGIDRDWAAKLERFDALSVRDENSRRLVRDGLDREPALVLDPCLQFPPPVPQPTGERSPYLALYGHGFPDWFAAAVRGWAGQSGRRIVSIGYRTEWADEQRIEAGPEEFSSLIAGADAVATNFFHGCVFALHHRRPFVCAPSDYRLNKVRDLTRSLAAGRHMVTAETSAQDYADLLGTPLDPAIDARIAAMRTRSSAYLASVLG